MKKLVFLTLTFTMLLATTKAADLYFQGTGNWSDNSKWTYSNGTPCNCTPDLGDQVTIKQNATVLHNQTTTIGNLTVETNASLINQGTLSSENIQVNGFLNNENTLTATEVRVTYGTVINQGSLNLSEGNDGINLFGNPSGSDDAVVENFGTIVIDNTQGFGINLTCGSSFTNKPSGMIRISNSGRSGVGLNCINLDFINQGRIYIDGADQGGVLISCSDCSFDNSYLVDVQNVAWAGLSVCCSNTTEVRNSGEITISMAGDGVNANNGPFTNDGSISVRNIENVGIRSSGFSSIQNNGQIILGENIQGYAIENGLNNSNGTIIGGGTIGYGFGGGGNITVGENGIGTFSKTEATTTTLSGNLNIDIQDINGPGVSGGHDLFESTGHINLGGALNVSLLNPSYFPESGSTFEIISARSVSGTFDQVNFPIFQNDLWDIQYNQNSVELIFIYEADWFEDLDGDGYGNENEVITTSTPPDGYVTRAGDCNDNDATVCPSCPEICDGIDNNCNGKIEENISIPAPQNLKAEVTGNNQVTVTWKEVPSSEKYIVRSPTTSDTTTNTQLVLNNISVNNTFSVIAVCGNTLSDSTSVNLSNLCEQPTEFEKYQYSFKSFPKLRILGLRWNKIEESNGYHVRVKNSPNEPWRVSFLRGNSYQIRNVTPNQNFYIQVAASCSDGNLRSDWSDTQVIFYDRSLESKPNTNHGTMSLYPNPVKNGLIHLSIADSQKSNSSTIQIRDVSGKVLKTTNWRLVQGYNDIELDVSDLSPGVYFIHAGIEDALQVQKLIIQ